MENCPGCPRIPVQSVSYNDARTLVRSVYIKLQIFKIFSKTSMLASFNKLLMYWFYFDWFPFRSMVGSSVPDDWIGGLGVSYKTGPGLSNDRY